MRERDKFFSQVDQDRCIFHRVIRIFEISEIFFRFHRIRITRVYCREIESQCSIRYDLVDSKKQFWCVNIQNKCECTTDPAWLARSAIAKWQVDSEICTHRPGSRKRGLRSAQRDFMRAALKRAAEFTYALNHFNSLMDFIKHA